MKNSIGVIIFNINGNILITKPTGNNIYSFPKGINEDGEDFLTTAIRETYEETNIDLTIIDGYFSDLIYNSIYKDKNKTVYLYTFYSNIDLENHPIICNSFFSRNGKEYPENDGYLWLKPKDALSYLHYVQKNILENIL